MRFAPLRYTLVGMLLLALLLPLCGCKTQARGEYTVGAGRRT